MNIYSLLICGGIADVNHYDEFWNDTACMWEILQRKAEKNGLGIKDENIIVFYGNGDDFSDPDGKMTKYCYKRPLFKGIVKGELGGSLSGKPTVKLSEALSGKLSEKFPGKLPILKRPLTDYPATSENIEKVLSSLSSKNDIDLLFVWTFGHGFRDENNSYLLLADDSKLYDYRLAELIGKINCKTRIICMQQCFSGGFIDNLKEDSRNIILTSCSDFASAYPTNDNIEEDRENSVLYSHGEFNYHLYNAVSSKKFTTEGLRPGDHEKVCEMMLEVYKYISDKDNIDEESTQYYDSINGYWNEGPETVDFLRSNWTFSWNGVNKEERGPIIEFSYPLTEMYRADKNKQVYLSIDGRKVHTFNSNNYKLEVSIIDPGKFSLNGCFAADFEDKSIIYIGKVYSRAAKPYCIGYEHETNDKSYGEKDNEDHEWKIRVFSWV
jgi:hypothetical protein